LEDGVLTIVGVGLIGGSVGLAAKSKGLFAEVRGSARHKSSLDAAVAAGAIDRGFLDPVEAARGADMVVVATTVSTIPRFCIECGAVARDGAIVTDVGSVKGAIEAAVQPHMPYGRHYIGSHPLAGSEKRGMANAQAGLLAGAVCILTPTEACDSQAYAQLRDFWQALGMTVFRMSPREHDAILANVSHLPHLVAAALVASVSDGALPFAATGFRDTTRVASSDAALWRDIIQANQEEVLAAIGRFEKELGSLKELILRGDFDSVQSYLDDAAHKRSKRFDAPGQGGTV
jgi:prephenate dehydrogenase